jgi:putative endonuclease
MLEGKGFIFLAANYRTKLGEVDLVMRDKDAVVFVEVRERMNEGFGRGFETVTAAKQGKIAKAALAYVKEKKLANVSLRFDVVSWGPRGGEHIPNAFVPAAGRYSL